MNTASIGMLFLLTACGPREDDTGADDTGTEQDPTVRSVDLSGATGFVFIRPTEVRTTIQGAGQGELFKVLDGGTTERLFPEGWVAAQYGVGPSRFLVALGSPHWFEAIDDTAAHPGFWCLLVSFRTDSPEEQPLTCHLPFEVLDACDDPEGDPSELGQCTQYPVAYDIGPDDTVWAVWDVNGDRNVYAWTHDVALRATPAGVLEADLNQGEFAAVEGGVVMNGSGEIRLESYWLDGEGGADLAMLDGMKLLEPSDEDWSYQGRKLVLGENGDGVLDVPTRSLVHWPQVVTFTGATPTTAPVTELWDAGRPYIRSGSGPSYQFFHCDGQALCNAIPSDDTRLNALRSAYGTVSDGEVTYLMSATGEYFLAGDVISDELGADWLIADVRVLGDKLHMETVDEDNVAHLYRVDFVDGAFTYTETDTWGPETMAIIPLAWPSG